MMNLFFTARAKLTLYYLAIIMIISVSFSVVIYRGAVFELDRIENSQRLRRPNQVMVIDPEVVRETKQRVAYSLLTLNIFILAISGVSGYFLAGKTLKPIKNMVDDQKTFVSNASHQLRTPLSSIKSEIEVALRDKKLKLVEAKSILNSNLDEINKMTKLTNYLLALNKHEEIKTNSKLESVDLKKIIQDVVGNSKIKTNLFPAIVKGDAGALTELVTILVDNAIKYGQNKPVEVTLSKNKTLIVKDLGLGIPKRELPHIFDRFYRGSNSKGVNGYGIGLSLAKKIADSHGAEITVKSKEGQGSYFKVKFS